MFASLFTILAGGIKVFTNYSLYLEASSEGQDPINHKYAYTIKGISDLIENNTFILKSSQAVSIPEQKQEPASATTNISTTQTEQPQPVDTNETAAEIQSENKTEPKLENKTKEELIVIETPKPRLFNKISLFIVLILVVFLTVIFIIFRVRKRKKESSELVEKIEEKLETINEQNK
jgi:hypothetical protein